MDDSLESERLVGGRLQHGSGTLRRRQISSALLFQSREVNVSDDGKDLLESPGAPARREASVTTISLLMIADIVGVGVLSLGIAFAYLGWVLGTLLLLLMFPLNVATGLMLWEGQQTWPGSFSYQGLVRNALGPTAGKCAGVLCHLFIFSMLGDYVLSGGLAAGMTLYDQEICLPAWSAIVAVGLVLPLHQFRSLASLGWIVWVNVATLTAALLSLLVYLGQTGPPPSPHDSLVWHTASPPEAFSSELSFKTFWKAVSLFAFAYSGQFLYIEMMAEMREPAKFPAVFGYTGPYQVGMYGAMAATSYAYLGAGVPGFLVAILPFGPLMRAVSALLLAHVVITYLVKVTVLARALHLALWPACVNENSAASRLQWLLCTFLIMLAAWVLANSIPIFEDLSGLLGATIAPPIVFNVPCLVFVAARHERRLDMRWWEVGGVYFTHAFGLMLLVFGTYANVSDIVAAAGTPVGGAMSCRCDGMWSSVAACCEVNGENNLTACVANKG